VPAPARITPFGRCPRSRPPITIASILFFRLTSLELGLLLFGVLLGATGLGAFLGRRVRHRSETLKEPFGVLQAALLGVVGLLLAFGLSLAVTRYEDRRANVVTEANSIGTTYLRAQTLAEPSAAARSTCSSATRAPRSASPTMYPEAPRLTGPGHARS